MPTSDPTIVKPSKLWKRLSAERRQETALAFWVDSEDVAAQAEAVQALARHLKFRPQSVLALPREKQARYLTALPAVSDSLATRLLITYHLTHQRSMMAAFLDALGVAHEQGLITADEVKLPEAETCRTAGRDLLAAFPPDDVKIYFATLLVQDPDAWAPLEELL
jgi:hypothetical protein